MAEWYDFFRIIPEVNQFMTWKDNQADMERLSADYPKMVADPAFIPDASGYSNKANYFGLLETARRNRLEAEKLAKEAKKEQAIAKGAPAYQQILKDFSDPANRGTSRAEILAYQNPEDFVAFAEASPNLAHVKNIIGGMSEEEQYKNQKEASDAATAIRAEQGLSQLFGRSATPEKYPGTQGNIPFDASLAYEWAGQQGIPPTVVKPILDQFKSQYENTYGPEVTKTLTTGNASKVVRGKYNAFGNLSDKLELSNHPQETKPRWTTYYKPDGSDSIQVDTNDATAVAAARESDQSIL